MKPNYASIEKGEPVIKGIKIKYLTLSLKFEQIKKIFSMKKIKVLFTIALIMFAVVVFGQEVEPIADVAKKADLKMVWQWLNENWGWIAAALLAVSEGLASSKLKANSIFQLVQNWLRKKAKKE